jgi:hypothetical protein
MLQATENYFGNHFGVPEQLLRPGEVTHGHITPVPCPPCAPSMSQGGANVIRVSGVLLCTVEVRCMLFRVLGL